MVWLYIIFIVCSMAYLACFFQMVKRQLAKTKQAIIDCVKEVWNIAPDKGKYQ